jgi:hypothetical protein
LLGRFAVALDQAKVTSVALKGPVLAEFSYPEGNGAKGELTLTVHGLPMVDLHWHLVYLRSAASGGRSRPKNHWDGTSGSR